MFADVGRVLARARLRFVVPALQGVPVGGVHISQAYKTGRKMCHKYCNASKLPKQSTVGVAQWQSAVLLLADRILLDRSAG